jgi:glycosyltransferase involved in cell wall biosynthesis
MGGNVQARKILQITSYPPPRAGWGMRVEFLKRRLETEGHTCVVLNIGPSRRIPSPEYDTVLGAFDYVQKVWRYSREGFTVHVHANGASPKGFVLAILAEAIAVLCGRRCLLTFHAGIEQIYFPRPKYPALLPVFKLLFALPERIICNSDAVKAKIAEYGVPAAKIVPIPAFSTQYLDYRPVPLAPAVEAFFARFHSVVFCYTKIRPLFYPEELIDGFARVAAERPDVGLLLCGVAGHAEGWLWDRVQARIAHHGLADRLCIVEDFNHEEFLTALSRSAMCVRTHLSDGVCSSVLEALALGIPVVATENGDRPRAVLTYPADDPQALARLIHEVLDNRESLSAALLKPEVTDTLAEEAALLVDDRPVELHAVRGIADGI